jgi:Glutamyl-tRNAGlu reductase, N-terminal domain
MSLVDLVVLNRRTATDAGTVGRVPEVRQTCVVKTCLREVQVTTRAAFDQGDVPAGAGGAGDLYQGADAYGFLLRLASGLESEIAGETEIFGQIKESWRRFEEAYSEGARPLRPWMQRLLQETKEIRSEYIVGLGSATYGSLARRLIGGRPEGTTLLVGAGQLAATILPYLDSADLRIYNRSPSRAFEMLRQARARDSSYKTTVLEPTLESELSAWRDARDVVLCVPADAERDPLRVAAWQAHAEARGGRILHLGIMSATGTAWEGVPRLATLQELFSLRDAQAEQRDALLLRARRACLGKAQLALLDDSDGSRPGNSNHGWEDLAVFQALGT